MLLKKKESLEKIVVLNSGGFDSIVLMNYLKVTTNTEIHSLHFHYGALNEEQQQRCVDKVCKKVGAVNKVIELPKFEWTKGSFYSKDYSYESQYIEYRNLVFIAYALSYAESIGAKNIYVAVLGGSRYNDTNKVFFRGLNSFATKNSDIRINTPFSDMSKEYIASFAIQTGVKTNDYFSCDVPKEGEPCGKCLDCQSLKEIEELIKIDTPMKAFYQGGYDFSNPLFKELLSKIDLYEVRALINNDCQLKCEHCFYGFNDMKEEPLSKEDYYKVLKEFVLEHGVKNIHFSGKEPLFNDDMLWFAKKIKGDHLPCTFNLVTNGINIPKYAEDLKECGIERISLSIDDILESNGVRSVSGVSDKALKVLTDLGIKTEVFIDLHHNNFDKIGDIINYLESNYKVSHYFMRTIRSIGNAKNQETLTGKQIDIAWSQILECSKELPKKDFTFNVGIEYLPIILGTTFIGAVDDCERSYTTNYTENMAIYVEEFCQRYGGNITLTPDGYLLGCASEVSCPNYDKISVGNVKREDLADLIEKGRKITYSCNDHFAKGSSLKCSCVKL